jgi:murein L,D-transpeptidase YcbB/YkuD
MGHFGQIKTLGDLPPDKIFKQYIEEAMFLNEKGVKVPKKAKAKSTELDMPNYLKTKRMEIVRKNDSLPEIRQLPGPGNALGKVKFLFPNSYDIYLHDTEAKDLFENNKRAFSHGCIRLANAEKMAEYVLREQQEWTPEKINAAMNSAKEQHVSVKKKIPVVITYFTTWVDEDGQLNFREDIYAHDKRMADKMFTSSI